MEPQQSGQRLTTRRRVIFSGVALVVAVAALVLVTLGPARDRDVSNLGVDVFDIGNTTRIATEIADRGPILIPDPLDRGRPIWIQHRGSAPDAGWSVFSAVVGTDCATEFDAEADRFVDCNDATYPPDGEGLEQYPVTVDGSVVSVDLNFAERAATDDGPVEDD